MQIMPEKKVITIDSDKRVIAHHELDADYFQIVEIHIPSSIEEMESSVLENADLAIVRVFYEGTVSDWKKIKKGSLEQITVKHDWYGYYYHNAPLETTDKESYYNWISCKIVTIICSDGTITDDEEENKKNPAGVSSSEHWD